MTSTSSPYGPREQGSWAVPGAPAYSPADASTSGRPKLGRPGLVALFVALVELVVIAAVGNQAVSKHALRYAADHQTTFLGRLAGSDVVVAWRFTPASGDNHGGVHVLYGQLLTIGVFVVLSALLTLAVVRGAVTFWRAFFGIWTAALAAMCVGRVVGLLISRSVIADVNRVTAAVFAGLDSSVVVTGVVIGLVAALIAALVAVATRRVSDAPAAPAAVPEPAYVPESPPPYYGDAPAGAYAPEPRRPEPHRPEPRASDPRAEQDTTALPSVPPGQTSDPGRHSTQQLPAADDTGGFPDGRADEAADGGDRRTTQLPRFDPHGGREWTPPVSDGGATQALPSTPDDRA